MWNEDHTSQLSRIKQRPPTRDFSGGNASADSLVPRRNSLAVADAVDFSCLNLFSSVVLGSPWSEPGASRTRSGTAEVFSLPGGTHQRQNWKQCGSPTLWFPDLQDRRCGHGGSGIDESGFFPANIAFLTTGSTIHRTTNIDL